ncbi:YecA family protein [Paludifilum halophilum]|nr:SEC-C metal-binding domain-containing protein [Paludifilum halophilum]
MVGRNDPCPCGSGKKYKKCCERVVAFRSAEQVREERELRVKTRLLKELDHWFEQRLTREDKWKWAQKFKQHLNLPPDQPVPSNHVYSLRFWLLFDAPCIDGRRAVDAWRETLHPKPEVKRVLEELCEICLAGYEVVEKRDSEVRLQALGEDRRYRVWMTEPLREGMFLFARLSRLGSRYELFGPYTSFGDEMRGEMMMYLKNQARKEGEIKREYWQHNGLQVLGWLMQRARDMEKVDKVMAQKMMDEAAPALEETAPAVEESASAVEKGVPDVHRTVSPVESPSSRPVGETETVEGDRPPAAPLLISGEPGVPEIVDQQLDQFTTRFVSDLQQRTQLLYQNSLKLFRQYVSEHFGKSFNWTMLTEEVLSHFFAIWYMDQGQGNPVKAKIFMNTMKKFFFWLQEEAITDIYTSFVPVYQRLTHQLPVAFEARRWLEENGVSRSENKPSGLAGTYQLAISAAGATLNLGDKWLPVQINLRALPPAWMENRFWVRGAVAVQDQESTLTRIEGVYPFFELPQAKSV